VGYRTGLDDVAKRRICPCRELNPGRPARSLVSILTELPPASKFSLESSLCSWGGRYFVLDINFLEN
jgi:hypothetical protein